MHEEEGVKEATLRGTAARRDVSTVVSNTVYE